jgi:hypothetical protein
MELNSISCVGAETGRYDERALGFSECCTLGESAVAVEYIVPHGWALGNTFVYANVSPGGPRFASGILNF